MLCSMLGVPVLLTDDLAARDAAKVLGLTPVGSLGIIARACQMGRITTDEAGLRECLV
jgi:predicted nucleic acid-binding protein